MSSGRATPNCCGAYMIDAVPILVAVVPTVPLLGAVLTLLARSTRQADRIAVSTAIPTASAALILAGIVFARGGRPALHGHWYLLDGASGLLLAVIAVIGLCSTLVSPAYLRTTARGAATVTRSHRPYYAALFVFWAALLAVPACGNLAITWLIVEATTAASALLVAFTGRREALEAGWKYLVLTTLGLSVALLGIVVLAISQADSGHHGLSALDWHTLRLAAAALPKGSTLIAFVLLLAGLATKVGWAPVHNWLPDAHSEAPAPISALLSAALLPSVLLVAWRVKQILEPSVGIGTTRALFLGFGLASLLVAVPFLWRSMPWKRLLAYSSLEHMGVIALGIGFGTPLAIAGVVVHIAGHALAKALGFYAALPLLGVDPAAATTAPSAVASSSPSTAAAMGVSLVALAGMPPSPLFLSELLILLGGVAAGQLVVSAIAVIALGLGFLGLLHSLVEGVIGDSPDCAPVPAERGQRTTVALTAVFGFGLLALLAAGPLLVGSSFIATLTRGTL
jgi:hydrogenase-4 component F